MGSPKDIGATNQKLVLGQVMRQPGISRSLIGSRLNLNAASVSRIARSLIDSRLIQEVDAAEKPTGRPGRRFVGLSPRGAGGYVIGMGLNAFRQSVTLADLENNKLAEWVSDEEPGEDGPAFMRTCVAKAAEMVAEHVATPDRLFGVGIAIAAELDAEAGIIKRAPALNWSMPIDVGKMVRETLGVPLALELPALAINMAEADFGCAKDVANVATLHCSLGFGMGVRTTDGTGAQVNFGCVLNKIPAPDGSQRLLSEVCGGLSALGEVLTSSELAQASDSRLGRHLVELVDRSRDDKALAEIFRAKGRMAARYISLTLAVIRPEVLLLAGPLIRSPEYLAGFRTGLEEAVGMTGGPPRIDQTSLTPTGASRLLALREHVLRGNLDLSELKSENAG
ncbi:MAG: ROK family protein [Roseovarius sp.]